MMTLNRIVWLIGERRGVIGAATALGLSLCAAAYGQPLRPVRPPVSVRPQIVVYEQNNFGGRSIAFAPGNYPLTEWKASSIKVPAGLAAIIFESADSGGGFGRSVDLLEDHIDLTPFGLNGKVSFVSVFSTTSRPGFFWARNSTVNGQFVAGHWERNRAAGNPVNRVAVVSPPLPSRTPAQPTVITAQGATWTITSLGPQTPADMAQWTRADSLMGVIGSDFRGAQAIGSAAFERASNNDLIPDSLNFWYPQKQPNDHRSVVYFKRTLTGTVADTITKNWTEHFTDPQGKLLTIGGTYSLSDAPHIANISGTYPDHDLNIDVIPFADYQYLIKDAHKPEKSTEVKLKDLVDDDHDPCTDPFIKVETEIDSGNAAKEHIQAAMQKRIGKQVAMYGPWIYDIGHCDHPEIHPAEQIWWTDGAGTAQEVYHLNVFADSSQRFWWRSQMDDGTKLHPWAAPPVTGLFAIAFEVGVEALPTAVPHGKKFEVVNVDVWNVADVPGAGQIYNLVHQGQTLVSFVPHNSAFKVSFENVGLKPGTTNIVRGLLVIETTVGIVKQVATSVDVRVPGQLVQTIKIPEGADPDKIDQLYEKVVFHKEEGHYVFTVTKTDIGELVVVR
jgi:hypothetical protein